MGPTNLSLVKLMQADLALRQAAERHEAAAKSVRIQERRAADIAEKLKLAQTQLREQQSHAATMNLDITSREERIERFRTQQQNARNNKEYQAFLTEINTGKIDQEKIREERDKVDEQVMKLETEIQSLTPQLQEQQQILAEIKEQLAGKLTETQAQVDQLKPGRQAAAAAVPQRARDAFERLLDRTDGEAMAAIRKSDPRREEYVCAACNMGLVVDVHNRLHTRDDLVFCPSCHRILYIPDDLPPELAVGSSKAVKEKKEKKEKAPRPPKGPRAPRAKKAAVSLETAETSIPVDPTAAATPIGSPLESVLTTAQGESVKGAMDADHAPVECEVFIDDASVGSYKGKSADHLERVIRFRLGEAGLGHQVRVAPKVATMEPAPARSASIVSEESGDAGQTSGAPSSGASDPTAQ